MITICHLGVAQSDRIVWLMEELGLPYQLEWYDRGPDFMSQGDFQALHPAASAPIIRDGDLVLPESVAIVEYISHRYADSKMSVAPGADNYPDYMYWMQLNNRVQSFFVTKMALGEPSDDGSSFVDMLDQRQQKYYLHLDKHLASNSYLAGDEFSNADIMAMFPLTVMAPMAGTDFSEYENTKSYIQRISDRPAYKKAMQIAGPEAQRPE